ncbi:hypothetical protein HG530_014112 [Fusarium avenaceum]|nr:hypothetical protein HG530_014112 [Fusarium avenaceum]
MGHPSHKRGKAITEIAKQVVILYSLAGPLNTENLSKLLQVIAKLLIEELDTKLASQKGNVLDNGKSYSPLLILSELGAFDILLLSKNGSQSTDLGSKRSTDVLRCIRDEILNTAHNIVEEDVTVDESAEAGNLASNGGSHLGLVIFEKLYESGNEVPRDNLLVNCLSDLQKVTLILYQIAQSCQQDAVASLLLFGNSLGDGDKNLDRE